MAMKVLAFSLACAWSVSAVPVQKRAACSSYTIIDTRGTGEAQGPSAGFRTMNGNIMRQVPGGKEYDTVYPAGSNQDSTQGTQDIVNKVTSTLNSNPNECFILKGYSQGAAATVDAMPKLTGAAFDAVVGVFLIGDPEHKSGLTCNVDNNGGTSTRNVNGISATFKSGIPSNWVSKTLDVCISGDGVCDSAGGFGITPQHLQYPNDAPTQNLGTQFVVRQLQAQGASPSSPSSPTSPTTPSFPFPTPTFGFPTPTFGFPQPSFGFPTPTFGFPQPSFGIPMPSFGFPMPSFP